jgi:hypothetical protein
MSAEAILLTGKRGNGKGLFATSRIVDTIKAGRMVATNMNLFLEHVVPLWNKVRPWRLPDWPTAADLGQMPLGNKGLAWAEGFDEKTGMRNVEMLAGYKDTENGLLVLDEVSGFLNSRDWQNKDRQAMLDWLAHSRKYGWDLLFTCQHQKQIDAQLRESLFELWGVAKDLGKIEVQVLGRITRNLLGWKLKLPTIYQTTVRMGFERNSPVNDVLRVWDPKRIQRGYDTLQKIHPALGVQTGCGYQMLSAWDLKGRHISRWTMYRQIILMSLMVGITFGVVGDRVQRRLGLTGEKPQEVAEATAPPDAVMGYLQEGGRYRIALADGSSVLADRFTQTPTGWRANVGKQIYTGAHAK